MRKGERSRFIRRLAKGNASQKEGDDIRRALIVDLCGEKGLVPQKQALNSTIVCESEGENLAVEDGNNGGTRRKENKGEAGSSSNLSVGVRVLRAFSRMGDGERSNIKEKGGVLTGKRKEFDVFEIGRDNEEATQQFVSVKGNKKVNNGARELKRKGRRPRIIDLSAQDEALGEIHGVDRNEIDGMHSSRPMIWLKQIEELFVELHGPNIHKAATSPLRSHTADAGEIIRTKQFARKLILKQLLGAGWTVDRKSRDGSEYEHDVVYVSPQGQTHWSIKLAYHKLQSHYEAHHGERKGFKFAPVPQMILNVLTDQEVGSSGGLGNPYLTSSYEMPVQMRDKKKNRKRNKKQCVAYYGKRTVLSWMIDLGTIQIDEPVYYVDHRCKCVLMGGMISRGGIHCGCCNEIISISEFEAHSRRYMLHSFSDDPLRNICIEGGASLLHCMLKSWNKQHISKHRSFHFVDLEEDSHDDTCIACGDGGHVVLCDSCPSNFHRSCLDIQEVPSGEWHCMYCCCKFCGLLVCDPYTNQIGSTSTSTSHSIEPSLFTCCFCERKYHKSFLEANRGMIVHSSDAIYCGNICQQLCERLERLLGVKHEMEDEFSSTFICRSNVDSHMEPHMIECNSKLVVALLLMDECFAPHIDQRTGINVIHSVLYNIGSNFERLNNGRFVTAILEKDDEIICAASIRIHGNQLAEMPYIATRYAYRRQGMCHRFLNAIESALRSLNVVLLVIPALSEVKKTWISAFGFEPLTSRTKQIIRSMNLLRFPGAEMLQKRISTHDFSDENLISSKVSNLQKNKGVHISANNRDGAATSGSAENIIYLSD